MSKTTKAERADVDVAMSLAPARGTATIKALGALSELADQPPLISACAAVVAAGVLLGNEKMAKVGLRMLLSELAATQIKSFIKHRVDRTRPRVVADGRNYRSRPGRAENHEMTSFPSGHTAGAVAVARAFTREYPGHQVVYALAAGVGIVQVPRSTHYPSDVAAGAIAGLCGEKVIDLWVDLVEGVALRSQRARTRSGTPPTL